MKHIRKSIAISLLCLASGSSLPTGACIWMDTHNNYLYSIYDSSEFQDCAAKTCDDNWKTYLGLPADDYFYFRADEVAAAARQRGDELMATYAEQLGTYLNCAGSVMDEQWDYPTKEQISEQKQSLLQVKAYAASKLKSRLRSQHALLFMRCNMMLGLHQENITFWEQTANGFIETVYKDMMQDIYAGALLRTGRGDEAGAVYAALGDWKSLMTQYYKRRSFQAISEEYVRDPNSAVLPFMLQDFVNNTQEAVDMAADPYNGLRGKLFVRDITKDEAMQMCRLARQAASEGKSRYPVMWQSALAWLEYLYGDKKKATADIMATTAMEGTERMKDCAHLLRLYITADNSGKDITAYDRHLARELKWLDSLSVDDGHYSTAKDRLVHKVLAQKYFEAGRKGTALALLRSVGAYCYFDYIDTMSVESLREVIAYNNDKNLRELDNYVAPALTLDNNELNDLMGTKLLRQCQWKDAQQWLTQVPVSYYQEKGYAVYAAFRKWDVEPWIKRQWIDYTNTRGDVTSAFPPLKSNPKLVFAREMQEMEAGLGVLTGVARQQRCYDLAVRYAQSSFTGDCWFIMRNFKSVSDTLRANEADLQAKAKELLAMAAQTTDKTLRRKSLFAMAYSGFYEEQQWWYEQQWNSEEYKYFAVPLPHTLQFKAFAALADFDGVAANGGQSRKGTNDYISRCDEYKQFLKHYRRQ